MKLFKSKIEKSINNLRKKLKNDIEYYNTWKDNIAMSYIDAENNYKKRNNKKNLNKKDKHIIADEASDVFLNRLMN